MRKKETETEEEEGETSLYSLHYKWKEKAEVAERVTFIFPSLPFPHPS